METTRRPRAARHTEVRSLDSFRRAQRVRLVDLAGRCGYSASWLSRVFAGKVPITSDEARALRAYIAALAAEALAKDHQS